MFKLATSISRYVTLKNQFHVQNMTVHSMCLILGIIDKTSREFVASQGSRNSMLDTSIGICVIYPCIISLYRIFQKNCKHNVPRRPKSYFNFPADRSNFLKLSWQFARIDGENKRNYAEYCEFIRGTKGMHRLILARYSYLIYQSSVWIRMGAIEAVRH